MGVWLREARLPIFMFILGVNTSIPGYSLLVFAVESFRLDRAGTLRLLDLCHSEDESDDIAWVHEPP